MAEQLFKNFLLMCLGIILLVIGLVRLKKEKELRHLFMLISGIVVTVLMALSFF